MKRKKASNTNSALVMQELKENPYRRFNFAFYLMSVIPFLVFLYLLVARFFSYGILFGDIGLIMFISAFLSVCGFYISYGIIKKVLSKIIIYAAAAKRSDQLKSTFVATVSHELKNPLVSIKLSLANLIDGFAGEVTDKQRNIIGLCYQMIERMERLIYELLDLHKIEAGMLEMRRRLCDFSLILDRQLKEFEGLLGTKRIKLQKDILGSDFSFWADEDKITRVLNNLISNAVKYSPEEGRIALRTERADEFIRFECADSGPGIPPDKITKIFNKFERIGAGKEGTGLGLSIAKDIVEMHRGKIWAENIPQGGSKFIVLLPCDLRKTPR